MTPDGGAAAAMTHPVEHLARTVATDAHTGQVEQCVWWCGLCRYCHTNACPSLFGGIYDVPCGHERKRDA